ncbi:MAG: SPOR domain-containing protein [Aquabacterium sp.]|jgi:DedD protein|nr:SPOR domain-containing protein [Aquabacterium sp.]
MPLPSFLKRIIPGASGQRPGAEPVSLTQADVEAVRVRARRRLIGMAVLVGAGVIGFPWLFETKPRPMAMDIAVVQQGASAPGLSAASSKPGVQAQVKSVTKPQPDAADAKEEFIEDSPAPKAAVAAPKTESRVAAVKVDEKKPAVKEPVKPVAAKPSAPAAKSAASNDKPASAAAVRYVVQIGAFSDVPSAREVRMKAERAGLKTYTQVIGADSAKKIRVRLGPFEDKASADKAMAALKKAGLPGALLTL